MKFTRSLLFSAVALAASAVCAPAQDNNNNPNPDQPRGGGGPGGGNPEEFRQRMADRMKTMLKVNNDEWAVLQPLMENVQTKQREAMAGGFGGRGGPGGWGGPGGRPPGGPEGRPPGGPDGGPGRPEGRGGDRAGGPGRGGPRGGGSPEAQALRAALENDATSPEELKTKLTALREQRKKAAAELVQAREDLRKVVTVRQEATLVSMGMLE